MADSMVAGLFGLTPEMYQNQQYQQDLKRGYELAQLSPGAAAQAGLQASVGQLGRGVAGLMGVEDPMLNRITQRQQILGMIDPSKPETFDMAAQLAADRGDQQLAFGLRLEADKYKQQAFVRADEAARRKREADALLQQQEVQRIVQRAYVPGGQEIYGEDIMGQQVGVGMTAPSFDIARAAPELMRTAAGRAELKNLIDAQKLTRPETISVKEGETLYNYPTSPGGEYKPVMIGASKPTPFTGDMANAALSLYRTTDPSKIFAQAGQQGIDAVNAKALETTKAKRPVTTVTNTVSNNMQKGFGDTFTETISSNIKAGRAAVAANSAVQSMQTLLDEGVKTGFGQDTMLQLGRVGQFFDPEFKVKGLAGQEAFQSFATGVILPQVKQLGVNPTDADLKFIATGSPGLSKTPEGNKLLLSALQLKLNREQDLARFTNQFLASNQELVTKNPVQAYTKFNDAFDQYTQTSPLYGPAADSLRQRFNALGARSTGNPAARNALQRGGLTKN
jgi:hypothetical protein